MNDIVSVVIIASFQTNFQICLDCFKLLLFQRMLQKILSLDYIVTRYTFSY